MCLLINQLSRLVYGSVTIFAGQNAPFFEFAALTRPAPLQEGTFLALFRNGDVPWKTGGVCKVNYVLLAF